MADDIVRAALVGRDSELARLRIALDSVDRDGVARTVVIGGEAGIGKTSLIERFVRDGLHDGGRCFAGGCLPTGREGLPYAPFVEGLRALARSVEPGRLPALLGPGRAELARLLPEVGARVSAPGPGLEFDRLASTRLFEAVLDLLGRLAQPATVIVWIDDLQWADEGTLDLLGFLIRNLRATRALVLLSIRSEDLERRDPVALFLAELERDAGVERIELGALPRAAFGSFLRDRDASAPDADDIDALFERTGGNPFYAEQLIVAAGGVPPADARLPPGLHDVLVARLARLPDATQEVLRAAAAAGRRVDDDMLARIMDRPHDEIADVVRDALADGILVDADGLDDAIGGYAFRHALLREVAYGQLIRGERDRLHAAFARQLIDRGEIGGVPVTPSELAYHWVAARDIGHAVPALVEAGVAAERVYAFGEARRQFESALALWDQAVAIGAVGSPDRIAVMQRAAESAALSGAYDDAVAWGRAAITALEAQPAAADPIMAGRLHDRLRWFLWEAGDASAAEAEVEAALRLLPEAPPSALRARAEAQAAGLRLVAGDLEAAAALGRHALGVATQVGAEPEEALALGIVGWAEAALGDVDGGLERFRRGLAIAERLGGVEGIALGHANLAALLDRVGRTDESLAASMAGYDITRRLGVARTYGGILLGHASKALFDAGRWSEAIAISDTGLDLDPAARAAVLLHIHHARIDTNQGRFDAAADHLERAGTGGAAMDAATAARHLAATAELAMWRRRVADVRAATAEGRRLLRADRTIDPGLAWLAWFGLRAEADLAERSRPSRAGRPPSDAFVDLVLARLEADARSSETAEDARRRAIAGLCRAEIGRLNDEREPNRWADVGAAWSTIGRPALTAYARYREAAAILATRGVRRDAAALLQGAHGMALGLGATPLAEEVEILARHARIDLEAAPPSSVPDPARDLGLTEREQEVIALVAAGWTNQQIADALFITRKTASVHVSNLLGKLGAQNRSEAAAIAHRLGLDRAVPAPPD